MEERPLSSFGKKFVAAPLFEFKLDTKPFEGEDGSTPVKNCWYEEELWKFAGLIFRLLKYSPVIFNFNSWPIFFFLSFNVAMVEIKNFYAFFDIYHLDDDCFSGKKGMDYIVVNGHNTSKKRGGYSRTGRKHGSASLSRSYERSFSASSTRYGRHSPGSGSKILKRPGC